MKQYFIPSVIRFNLFLLVTVLLNSCQQEYLEPAYNVASGGGTVSTYKAYTLTSADSKNIYGRVVFYKYSSTVTLVQVGLYNTTSGTSYTSAIYEGTVAANSSTTLTTLDSISGDTGAFSTNKYFTISGSGFYDQLSSYNANVRIMSGNTIVASGDIGANATPVAEAD
ncbi:MAG: hypothetical protein QM669_04035 [Siphonobacter sp.]